MTNREAILKRMGDSLIACQLIEKVNYYKDDCDYRRWGCCIFYKFNDKTYHNFDEAYAALKTWLDEEEQTQESPDDKVVVRVQIPNKGGDK